MARCKISFFYEWTLTIVIFFALFALLAKSTDECDDENPCTEDWHDSSLGCIHENNRICIPGGANDAHSVFRSVADVVVSIEALHPVDCKRLVRTLSGLRKFITEWSVAAGGIGNHGHGNSSESEANPILALFGTGGGTYSPSTRIAIAVHSHEESEKNVYENSKEGAQPSRLSTKVELLHGFTLAQESLLNVLQDERLMNLVPAFKSCLVKESMESDALEKDDSEMISAASKNHYQSSSNENNSGVIASPVLTTLEAIELLISRESFPNLTLASSCSEMKASSAMIDDKQSTVSSIRNAPSSSCKEEVKLHYRKNADHQYIIISGLQQTAKAMAASAKDSTVTIDDSFLRVVNLIEEKYAKVLNTSSKDEKDGVHGMQFPHSGEPLFSILLDTKHRQMMDLLGSPWNIDAYKDHSHFNLRLTLSKLVKHSTVQASSLMAYLIRKQIWFRTWALSSLASQQARGNLYPGGIFPYKPSRFSFNKCVMGVCQFPLQFECTKLEGECDEGHFCSLLHGCVPIDNKLEKEQQLSSQPSVANTSKKHPFSDGQNVEGGTKDDDIEVNTEESDSIPTAKIAQTDMSQEGISYLIQTSPYQIGRQWTLDHLRRKNVKILELNPESSFIEKFKEINEPVLLRNTMVQNWPARKKWNLSYLKENIGIDHMQAVKSSPIKRFFDPDKNAPLHSLMNVTVTFNLENLSKEDFFQALIDATPSLARSSNPSKDDIDRIERFASSRSSLEITDAKDQLNEFKGLYTAHGFFSKIPEGLLPDIQSSVPLFLTKDDLELGNQYLWISSPGVKTHTHFDQDMNAYVQLVGKKRFTFFSSAEHELLSLFPRIHPMWHKSRVDFDQPDLRNHPHYKYANAFCAELEPGDVLLIPPYTWHHVESLTSSVSLSTWSHDFLVYDSMTSVYRHDHMFDLVHNPQGRIFSLRLYLDLVIEEIYGPGSSSDWVANLLQTRYRGLEHLFKASISDEKMCHGQKDPGRAIPISHHVYGYASFDTNIISEHFKLFSPETRDILFANYVEELVSGVMGSRRTLAFFKYCFHRKMEYYTTQPDDPEHSLWEWSTDDKGKGGNF